MTTTDRGIESLETLLGLLVPRLTSQLAPYAQWEYRVLAVTPGPPVLLDLVPVDPTNNPFGPLAAVKLYPGPDGSVAVPSPGSIAVVRFSDANPAKPSVCGLDPDVPVAHVFLAGVGAPPGLPVVRSGDQVTITQAQLTAANANVGGNPLVISNPILATATTGSLVVTSP